MDDDTTEPFGFPAIARKKVVAAFDGGRLTSDGGVVLLAAAGRELGLCDRLSALISGSSAFLVQVGWSAAPTPSRVG